jgi:hypothetical protein
MPPALLQRIDASITDLDRAAKALASADLGEILQTVKADFADQIANSREELVADRKAVENGCPIQECWSSFQGHRRKTAQLLLECLAFVQGVLLRRGGFDDGWCRVADRMLMELKSAARLGWSSFTLPADCESFASLAQIIRLRFPSDGIWDLPVAAHEFGHFTASKILATEPGVPYRTFDEFLKDEQAYAGSSWGTEHLHELFADAFATFALGPAYVRSCLYCRFSPGVAGVESDAEHPSYTSRARVILKVLEYMQAKEPGFSAARQTSTQWWDSAVKDAGQVTEAGGESSLAYELVQLLRDWVPHAEYGGWARAQALSARIMGAGQPADILAPETTAADILNAAWMARLSGNTPSLVNQRAFALCDYLAGRPLFQQIV